MQLSLTPVFYSINKCYKSTMIDWVVNKLAPGYPDEIPLGIEVSDRLTHDINVRMSRCLSLTVYTNLRWYDAYILGYRARGPIWW